MPIVPNAAMLAERWSDEHVAVERCDPCPHGIELPHMAEVTQARQTELAIGDHGPEFGRVKRCSRSCIGAIGAQSFCDKTTNEGQCRCRSDHDLPVERAECR